jgi:hypothetical protein
MPPVSRSSRKRTIEGIEENDTNETATCTICLDDIKNSPRSQTNCNHIFHTGCIAAMELYRANGRGGILRCPLCRTPILSLKHLDNNNCGEQIMSLADDPVFREEMARKIEERMANLRQQQNDAILRQQERPPSAATAREATVREARATRRAATANLRQQQNDAILRQQERPPSAAAAREARATRRAATARSARSARQHSEMANSRLRELIERQQAANAERIREEISILTRILTVLRSPIRALVDRIDGYIVPNPPPSDATPEPFHSQLWVDRFGMRPADALILRNLFLMGSSCMIGLGSLVISPSYPVTGILGTLVGQQLYLGTHLTPRAYTLFRGGKSRKAKKTKKTRKRRKVRKH